MRIFGIILAGGQGSRMGGADKALLMLAGQPLIGHAVRRLQPQVAALAISANGDPDRFAGFDLRVIADLVPLQGPLAGVLAGLDWAAERGADGVVSVAVDTPFFPFDLVARLAALPGGAMAAGSTGLHPTFALWPVALRRPLALALAAGERRLAAFADAQGLGRVTFPGPDRFFNINHPADLLQAAALGEAPTSGETTTLGEANTLGEAGA